MRLLIWLALALGYALLIYIFFNNLADASECLPSAAAVRAEHGVKAWSGWSDHISGHDGERCYFLSKRKEVMRSEQPPRVNRGAQRKHDARPVSATRAESPASAMLRIANELRWRRALRERIEEWFTIHNCATMECNVAYENKIEGTGTDRIASAFPAR